jgi:hypothetical protein
VVTVLKEGDEWLMALDVGAVIAGSDSWVLSPQLNKFRLLLSGRRTLFRHHLLVP